MLSSPLWAADSIIQNYTRLSPQLNEAVDQAFEQYHYTPPKLNKASINFIAIQNAAKIKTNLKPLGYYASKINWTIKHQSKQWVLHYIINPGPATQIAATHITITGDGKAALKSLQIQAQKALKPNQKFVYSTYDHWRTTLLSQAITLGYLNAKLLTHKVKINPYTHQAVIIIHLATGPAYHFGKITLNQHTFNPEFLRKFLPISEGAPYTTASLENTRHALEASGYFDNIDIQPHFDAQKNHAIPLTIQLTPTAPQSYLIGAGYSTQYGVIGLLGINFPYVTQSGQHFQASVQIAHHFAVFNTAYIIPGGDPRTDFTSINASRAYVDINPYRGHETTTGISSVKKFQHWQRSYGVNLMQYRITGVAGFSGFRSYFVPYYKLSYTHQTPAGYWKQGWYSSVQLQGTIKHFLSDQSFFKSTMTTRWAFSPTQNTSFFIQGSVGALATPHFNELAPPLRFYAGGVGSVRGYDYLSQGPTNSQGELTGGRYLLTSSVNLARHLWGNWSGLIFMDAGNAFNRIDAMNIVRGAGFGFEWRSPLGPIDFYISRPIGNSRNDVHIDLSIGTFL